VDARCGRARRRVSGTRKKKRPRKQSPFQKKQEQAIKIPDDALAKKSPDYSAAQAEVKKATAARRKEMPPPLEKLAVVMETDPEPPVHHVLHRGQHNVPAAEVQPGVPAALDPQNRFRVDGRPPGQISSGRRLAFARW